MKLMMKYVWMVPALAAVAFLALTVWVVATEGPLGFLQQHVRTAWGAQIFADLVISLTVASLLAVASARRVGVRAWPWLIAICASGSIGLLAFVARVLYAQQRERKEDARGALGR